MSRKQDLRNCAQLLVLLAIAVAMLQGQDQPIGNPLFAIAPSQQSSFDSKVMASAVTVAHWTSSFVTNGKRHSFSMVGSSPYTNPGMTTTIDTELQPIVFKFSNGTKISGSAAAVAIANSPIFVYTNFPSGGGQYADVFQRANFAKVIGTHPYHVRLGLPHIRPAIEIAVPKASGTNGKTTDGVSYGLVNFSFITKAIANLVKSGGYDPALLTIFVTGNVFEYQKFSALCCVLGYHDALSLASGQIATYVYASYPSAGLFNGGFADTAVVSHEVAEWMNDPFVNNTVAPWAQPQNPKVCFSDLLEVGDAIEAFSNANFTVKLNAKAYHMQDEAFFSWFARQSPSIGAGGRYSYLLPAKLNEPAPICN